MNFCKNFFSLLLISIFIIGCSRDNLELNPQDGNESNLYSKIGETGLSTDELNEIQKAGIRHNEALEEVFQYVSINPIQQTQ